MNASPPDSSITLAGLKDFQRDTVEHVFRRMYLDSDCTRRFLVADEVGLGKTLVARGVIAKTIEHLWDRTDRIDVVYVCSNSDIARQNIQRLNVTESDGFSLSSRITLLPITVGRLENEKVNFVSFTPGTSFDLKDSAGMSRERELLYWLLKDTWQLRFKKATRMLHAYAGIEGFRHRTEMFPEWYDIHPQIADEFARRIKEREDLRARWDGLSDAMPCAGFTVPRRVSLERNRQIGELRRLLAETCLHWLEPDLIILDEFQRFKHLLSGNSEEASEAAQLAEHLFTFQQDKSDDATAARVLLLSATPYKMYTQGHEHKDDNHYQDFQTTLEFLLDDENRQRELQGLLGDYREQLFRLADTGSQSLEAVKEPLERVLRGVMVRTERLALSCDRNGMLAEISARSMNLTSEDLLGYVDLQQIAEHLKHRDVLEYWKSAPYLLNFMEDYDLKRKLERSIDDGHDGDLARCVRNAAWSLLDGDAIEKYQPLDPSNPRLRWLHEETVNSGAWRLLWIPPSMPYYEGSGPFTERLLSGFTKKLVFSSWRVVPKAIASVLSYEAERQMIQRFRKRAKNTAEARSRRSGLLQFRFTKGRPAGMPVLAMLYPCRVLADQFDPLQFLNEADAVQGPLTQVQVLSRVAEGIRKLLQPILDRMVDPGEPVDERWYWAAPLLLDREFATGDDRHWIDAYDLAAVWRGEEGGEEHDASEGWDRHVEIAREVASGKVRLGPQPEDLTAVLAMLAVAAPGVVALRAIERVLTERQDAKPFDVRAKAGQLAHSFLHLFNLPEVMYLLRDREGKNPYWQSVLHYCVAGNLQSVIDEYAHILVESLGLIDETAGEIADQVSEAIAAAISIRTSTSKADIISANRRRVLMDDADAIRFRTRFAMRFGDQENEEGAEPTRADHVRQAFNSPFWPFVLATTSVGQEGLDFHPYCHAVVHWNLPSNPVDLEQREGRVHRYKGHALRKNIAVAFSDTANGDARDPWEAMFEAARAGRADDQNDLFPYWISPDGTAKIERHIPALPLSREQLRKADLGRSLVLYRMVFGQNRQEDLLAYLTKTLEPNQAEATVNACRIDLSPPRPNVARPNH